MAIETLKGVTKIDGFDVVVMDELREKYPEKFNPSGQMDYKWFEQDIRPHNFIYIRNDKNSIAFTVQKGPVGKFGVNGCQVDTIIASAGIMLEELNKLYPCQENAVALSHIMGALHSLRKRKEDREARGVEGKNKA